MRTVTWLCSTKLFETPNLAAVSPSFLNRNNLEKAKKSHSSELTGLPAVLELAFLHWWILAFFLGRFCPAGDSCRQPNCVYHL